MRWGFLAAGLLAAAPAAFGGEQIFQVERSRSEVVFHIVHMIGKVRGRFTAFSGQIRADPARPEHASVEFAIQAASINTGLPRRDDHLRGADFFDVKKYPEITFKSTKVTVQGKDSYVVHGPLSMHGVVKTVVLPVAVTAAAGNERGNETLRFEIKTTLDRKDYGIVWNKVLGSGGLLLGDDVDVVIKLEAVAVKVESSPPSAR
jgi:polyisoprenoid-binding protein YceI